MKFDVLSFQQQVCVWDVRNFEKPVSFSLTEHKAKIKYMYMSVPSHLT